MRFREVQAAEGPRLALVGASGSIPIRHRPEGAPAGGTGRRSVAQADAAHVVPLGAITVVIARHRAGAGIGVPVAAGVVTILLGGGIADRRRGWRRPIGLADVGDPERRAEGATVRVEAALGAAVAVLEGGLALADARAVGHLHREPEVSHRVVTADRVVLLDVLLHGHVGAVAGAAHRHPGGRKLTPGGGVHQVPAVPGGVGVVVLGVPGVATADVAPFAEVVGARAPEAGVVIVRARLVGVVGTAAEIEVDITGHRAGARRVGRVDVVAAHAVPPVVVALERPVAVHPSIQAVDREGAGAGLVLGLEPRTGPVGGGGRLPAAGAEIVKREPRLVPEAPLDAGELHLEDAAVRGSEAAQAALVEIDLQMRGLCQE